MKLFIVFLAACICASLASAENIHGENGWYVPQVDGNYEWVDKDVAESELARMSRMEGRLSLSPVNFYLYTASNPNVPQEITAKKASITASNFNGKYPTRFTIHGWSSGYQEQIGYGVRDAWLARGPANVIAVDWGRARSYDYASSVMAVAGVGEKVADLINFLRKNHGLKLETTTVIGHSLGAHVAGNVGKNVKNGQLEAIIGLDPALPLYSYENENSRLTSKDAAYVETIQTNGGLLGFLKPIGKAAFYPNGGQLQPGCGLDLTGACSHSRSVEYYIEAVRKNNFPTKKCIDYEMAIAKKCGSSYSMVRMAENTNVYTASGEYYVPVNSKEPFGMGQ